MNITKELESVIRAELEKRYNSLVKPLAKTDALPKRIAEASKAYDDAFIRFKQARKAVESAMRFEQYQIYYPNGSGFSQAYAGEERKQLSGFYFKPIGSTKDWDDERNWVAKNYSAIAVKLQYGKKVDVEAILREIGGLKL